MTRIKLCSLCGDEIYSGTFVSRRDNKTKICTLCAAFEDLFEREVWQSAMLERAQRTSAPN
jgi:hypothetical protein